MKGIRFDGLHTYNDFGLIQGKKTLGSPAVKKYHLDIPGADGVLDMTEFHGEPTYENVKHKFEFSIAAPHSEFPSHFSKVKNALHGRKGRIILDDDPSFYYLGRADVSDFTDEKGIGHIVIECDCEPYKYKLQQTIVTATISETETVVLTNSRKRAVPEITTTAAMTIAFGDGIWTTSAGTYTIPELELVEGDNLVTVTGAGEITFAWVEGSL